MTQLLSSNNTKQKGAELRLDAPVKSKLEIKNKKRVYFELINMNHRSF